MFEKEITKLSYKMLCLLYEAYLERTETESRESAKLFETIPDTVLVYVPEKDCDDCIAELETNDFVGTYIDGSFYLTNNAIICMENRFKKGLSELLDTIGKFIP